MWKLINRFLFIITLMLVLITVIYVRLPTQSVSSLPFMNQELNDKMIFKLREKVDCSNFVSNLLTTQSQEFELFSSELSHSLSYYAKNTRPDYHLDLPQFFVLDKATQKEKVLESYRKYYLVEGDMSHCDMFDFSSEPTNLWLEAGGREEELILSLYRNSSKGAAALLKQFVFPRVDIANKEAGYKLGHHCLDAHILMRQRAMWVGRDCFLNLYGDDVYQNQKNKERIDFQEEGKHYFCFVQEGDILYWREDQWHLASCGLDTKEFPLLVIEKIENTLMHIKIWTPDAKKTIKCLLSHMINVEIPKEFQPLKYIGARNHKKWLFESKTRRLSLEVGDWLLHHYELGWVKLHTIHDVESYVHMLIKGELFVIKALDVKEGKKILIGELFNSSRTDMKEAELLVENSDKNHMSPISSKKISKSIATVAKAKKNIHIG